MPQVKWILQQVPPQRENRNPLRSRAQSTPTTFSIVVVPKESQGPQCLNEVLLPQCASLLPILRLTPSWKLCAGTCSTSSCTLSRSTRPSTCWNCSGQIRNWLELDSVATTLRFILASTQTNYEHKLPQAAAATGGRVCGSPRSEVGGAALTAA